MLNEASAAGCTMLALGPGDTGERALADTLAPGSMVGILTTEEGLSHPPHPSGMPRTLLPGHLPSSQASAPIWEDHEWC